MSCYHQPFTRFPFTLRFSVMTVKSGPVRVSGLAAKSVTTMVVPGRSLLAISLTPAPSRYSILPKTKVGRGAARRITTNIKGIPLQEVTILRRRNELGREMPMGAQPNNGLLGRCIAPRGKRSTRKVLGLARKLSTYCGKCDGRCTSEIDRCNCHDETFGEPGSCQNLDFLNSVCATLASTCLR